MDRRKHAEVAPTALQMRCSVNWVLKITVSTCFIMSLFEILSLYKLLSLYIPYVLQL